MDNNMRWQPLEELNESRYKRGGAVGIGIRPTVKNLGKIATQTSEENAESLSKLKDAEERAMNLVNENRAYDREMEEKKVESKTNDSFINLSGVKKEVETKEALDTQDDDIKQNFMYTILGLGKLYINKTNSILNPLRFVMENKKKVLSALILFVVPALMTYYLTTSVDVFSNQIAQENLTKKALYTLVFYFSSMFVLLTCLVFLDMVSKGVRNLLNTAKEAGKEN